MRTAIVTTLIDAKDILPGFVQYHLAIGFDHIYLFFDDPYDPSIEAFENNKQLTCIRSNDDLRRRWQEMPGYVNYTDYHQFIEKEVQARQFLNTELACEMAKSDKIDWLLHIDVDELFYCHGEPVARHFERVHKQNITQMTYTNYEAIPERIDIIDCFKEITLFKKNAIDYSWIEGLIEKTKSRALEFNFYGCGKSAALVREIKYGGIHTFQMKESSDGAGTNKQKLQGNMPLILHYPIYSFCSFWQKYTTLGNFSDKWFDRVPIFSFHRECRDVVRSGDRQSAMAFYRKRVMVNKGTLFCLRAFGIVARITYPAAVLSKVQNETSMYQRANP